MLSSGGLLTLEMENDMPITARKKKPWSSSESSSPHLEAAAGDLE
jgi:hypothetical protein